MYDFQHQYKIPCSCGVGSLAASLWYHARASEVLTRQCTCLRSAALDFSPSHTVVVQYGCRPWWLLLLAEAGTRYRKPHSLLCLGGLQATVLT